MNVGLEISLHGIDELGVGRTLQAEGSPVITQIDVNLVGRGESNSVGSHFAQTKHPQATERPLVALQRRRLRRPGVSLFYGDKT